MLCEDDAMTFTTTGEIFTHLLLDRGKTFELNDDSWLDWLMCNLAHNVSVRSKSSQSLIVSDMLYMRDMQHD